MCGIVAALLYRGRAAPLLLSMLKRLEYRGYDSAGMATCHNGQLFIKKDKGMIDQIEKRLRLSGLPGRVGIGHTRWATHGPPSKENAHPHMDCPQKIAVVHNGIIENYVELKSELIARGHIFRSETDTEVIPHLIEEFLSQGYDLPEAVLQCFHKLKGSFAIAVVSSYNPDMIVGARMESPLVLGIFEDGLLLSSDVPAFLEKTNRVVFINDGELVVLTKDGYLLIDSSGQAISRPVTVVDWTFEKAQKAGYPHFMIKEIMEQPVAIRDTLRSANGEITEMVNTILRASGKLYFVASGTSYHASLVGKYLFAKVAHVPFESVISAEFHDAVVPVLDESSVVFGISQSGETADTKTALKEARKRGAKIISMTNVLGSSITRISDLVCYTHAGPEIGVAATKTFTTQVALLTYMALRCAAEMGYDVENHISSLDSLPKLAEEALNLKDDVFTVSRHLVNAEHVYFIGRSVGFPLALEGALKLKEISYIHAEGSGAGEYKHGPLALIAEGTPVVAVVTPGTSLPKMIGNIEEVKARGADVIAVFPRGESDVAQKARYRLELPNVDEILSPIPYIIPLQLLAYYTATLRGLDPDKPRNLAKSVTVE